MKTIISNMKQELIVMKSKEKNVNKKMMKRLGKFLDRSNNLTN